MEGGILSLPWALGALQAGCGLPQVGVIIKRQTCRIVILFITSIVLCCVACAASPTVSGAVSWV